MGSGGSQLQGASQSEQDHKPWKFHSSSVLRSCLSGEKLPSSENLTSVSVRFHHLSHNAFYHLCINSSVFPKRTFLRSSIAGVICLFFYQKKET